SSCRTIRNPVTSCRVFLVSIQKTDEENEGMAMREGNEDAQNTMATLQASMEAIREEIMASHTDMKKHFSEAWETMRVDMKQELGSFKDEVNKKMDEVGANLKSVETRVEEMEQRVGEVEEWSVNAKEVLLQTVEEQQRMLAKLTDLETRSRKNNLRIFGIPEDQELLKTELGMQNAELGIQRCHRSLDQKPPTHVPPRSMIVCFLEYNIKEQVLKKAWLKKNIRIEEHRIYMDHGYPIEIIQKRKEYAPLRKILKEKGIRFQTPAPARLRVFYKDGPGTYTNVTSAKLPAQGTNGTQARPKDNSWTAKKNCLRE
uniref:L1 transposable element RRM domain-containing protein n=1 Tax=Nothobranchius furzeri TaxID=105023 RepID=A0A8C6P2N8_NOTFU